VAGLLPSDGNLVTARPFRAPHHSVSAGGLIGGGRHPHPGEVSLAHLGVLFLDELPEFPQHVLESLREPMEDGAVTIARVNGRVRFPARFQLVAAANPCRRGCRTLEQCLCTPGERERYLGRLSRPLLDRIDIHVELPAVPWEELATATPGDSSATIRARVTVARERQHARLGRAVRLNAQMTARHVRRLCQLPPDAQTLLAHAMTRLSLSVRGHDRILKVARTIADLEGSETIATEHCAEAIQYRSLDRRLRP
jgi:magnesium chelatase family protein